MNEAADSPVMFDRRAGGREVALLGVIEVGELWPQDCGNVVWKAFLPLTPCPWSRPLPIDTARAQLRRKIEDWLDAAALVPIAKSADGNIRSYRDWDQIKQAVRS